MRYAWALGAVALATLINLWGRSHFDVSDEAMIYLLALIIVASLLPPGPSIVATLSSVLTLDLLFVEPRFHLGVADKRHIVTFAVMILASFLVSALTHRIRVHRNSALEREQRTESMYRINRELAVTAGVEALAEVALEHLRRTFGLEASVLIANPKLALLATTDRSALSPHAFELAEKAIELGCTVGAESPQVPSPEFWAVPLIGTRPFGTFLFRLERSLPTPRIIETLEAFVGQTAPAIERGLVVGEAERERIAAETERMRNALLAGVSHDLRTPLASIAGSVGVLLDPSATLATEHQRGLLEAIRDETDRLARMMNGLLDLARLESGALAVKKQWCPLEEVLASAIQHLDRVLCDRPLQTRLGTDELLLAPLDPVLFEQVLVNLLDNAAKYSPPGSPIEVSAWIADRHVELQISDRGPGLAPGETKRIFEKFYRARDGQRVPGAGLGLAVCDAIVKAHGGRIEALAQTGGGAVFRIGLPLEGAPS